MSTEDKERQSSIWLEVANVRRVNDGVEIQVKGDKADREPVWRKVDLKGVGFEDYDKTYRTITDALDKKRIVLANLSAGPETLKCEIVRIQYAESNSR